MWRLAATATSLTVTALMPAPSQISACVTTVAQKARKVMGMGFLAILRVFSPRKRATMTISREMQMRRTSQSNTPKMARVAAFWAPRNPARAQARCQMNRVKRLGTLTTSSNLSNRTSRKNAVLQTKMSNLPVKLAFTPRRSNLRRPSRNSLDCSLKNKIQPDKLQTPI